MANVQANERASEPSERMVLGPASERVGESEGRKPLGSKWECPSERACVARVALPAPSAFSTRRFLPRASSIGGSLGIGCGRRVGSRRIVVPRLRPSSSVVRVLGRARCPAPGGRPAPPHSPPAAHPRYREPAARSFPARHRRQRSRCRFIRRHRRGCPLR